MEVPLRVIIPVGVYLNRKAVTHRCLHQGLRCHQAMLQCLNRKLPCRKLHNRRRLCLNRKPHRVTQAARNPKFPQVSHLRLQDQELLFLKVKALQVLAGVRGVEVQPRNRQQCLKRFRLDLVKLVRITQVAQGLAKVRTPSMLRITGCWDLTGSRIIANVYVRNVAERTMFYGPKSV